MNISPYVTRIDPAIPTGIAQRDANNFHCPRRTSRVSKRAPGMVNGSDLVTLGIPSISVCTVTYRSPRKTSRDCQQGNDDPEKPRRSRPIDPVGPDHSKEERLYRCHQGQGGAYGAHRILVGRSLSKITSDATKVQAC
jgi:hypothetical protein